MRSKSYSIAPEPVAWKRPGYSTKHHRFYNTQEPERLALGLLMKQQHGAEPLFDRPLHMDITFYMPIPSSKTKKISKYYSNKPDLDNLIKHILDTASGILLTDDRIVCSISSRKLYADSARTEFTIEELE